MHVTKRAVLALVLALGLLGASVAETMAAPKLSCADASWDCLAVTPGKHK